MKTSTSNSAVVQVIVEDSAFSTRPQGPSISGAVDREAIQNINNHEN